MRAHQPQQETESLVCPEREVMGASEAGGMEHEQLYGNQAAIERLCFEPIDIDVIDQDGSVAVWFADGFASDDTQVNVESGVRAMVDDVILRAAGRPIRRLTITSHGRPGTFGLGENQVQPMSPPYMMNPLMELAPLFDEGGFVELHSCQVAAGEVGERLLRRLHELLGVPVTAGTKLQLSVPTGFEGTTITALTDENGELVIERDEHPVMDALLGVPEAAMELWDAGEELGAEAMSELTDTISGLAGSVELPEVGDLEEWLFGT